MRRGSPPATVPADSIGFRGMGMAFAWLTFGFYILNKVGFLPDSTRSGRFVFRRIDRASTSPVGSDSSGRAIIDGLAAGHGRPTEQNRWNRDSMNRMSRTGRGVTVCRYTLR